MRHLPSLLGGLYLVFLGWYGAWHFGADWRRDLLLLLLGVYAVLSVFAHLFERRVRRTLDAAAPEDIIALREADPEFDAFMQQRPRVDERADWGWRAMDAAGGVALTFHPPLAYTLWRHGALAGDTPVDGVAVALMLVGGALHMLSRRRRLCGYRCPRCAQVPARLDGVRIRYACARCGVALNLGPPVWGDPNVSAPPT